MNRTWKTILLGLIPLPIGFAQNYAMLLPLPLIIWRVFGFACCFLWGYLAYKTARREDRALRHSLKLNLAGLCMLVLLLVQRLFFEGGGSAAAILIPQFYFLPCLGPVHLVTGILSNPFPYIMNGTADCCLTWLLMAALSWYRSRKKISVA